MNSLELTAKQAVGNWEKFTSFVWNGKYDLKNPENYCIVYTCNRDSRLLELSNARAIKNKLQWFINHNLILEEYHNHWAVGYVEGYAIPVYTAKGKITKAFQEWYKIACELEDYPVLNEDDYLTSELDATIENIESELRYLGIDSNYTDNIYTWLSDNLPNELENRDDWGGYPNDDSIILACQELGIKIE